MVPIICYTSSWHQIDYLGMSWLLFCFSGLQNSRIPCSHGVHRIKFKLFCVLCIHTTSLTWFILSQSMAGLLNCLIINDNASSPESCIQGSFLPPLNTMHIILLVVVWYCVCQGFCKFLSLDVASKWWCQRLTIECGNANASTTECGNFSILPLLMKPDTDHSMMLLTVVFFIYCFFIVFEFWLRFFPWCWWKGPLWVLPRGDLL